MSTRLSLLLLLGLAACGPAAASDPLSEAFLTPLDALHPAPLNSGQPLRVVATTSIVADVVSRVAGDAVELHTLIPAGTDPHAFEPGPKDARALTEADLVFVNGFGLETFMAGLLQDAGSTAPVVSVSQGIEPIRFGGGGEASGIDPHTWLDPRNVIVWTSNIEAALSRLDPARATGYAERADAYRGQLTALDNQARQVLSTVPAGRRKLVTDHDELGYFARAYDFTIVGTVIPGASSLAEPSPQELAALLDKVKGEHVPAVFVSAVVNPSVVDTFAADAGVRVVTLYAHTLTGPAGPAPSYLDLVRYNAEAIAAALTP
jgi:zinc/manganese transport system substrate-binding protein